MKVGMAVEVLWPMEAEWYKGIVHAYDAAWACARPVAEVYFRGYGSKSGTADTLSEGVQPTFQPLIHQVNEMDMAIARCMQQLQVTIGVRCSVMVLMDHAEATPPQLFGVGHHRGAMQEPALLMHPARVSM